MAYTSHGRHIPGTSKIEGEIAGSISCPGIDECPRCKREIETSQHHQYIIGTDVDYQAIAKQMVRDYVAKLHVQNFKTLPVPQFEVYVIWFSKTLQNWKGILATTLPDGKIYELTHDGNKRTTYFDSYGKLDNFAIPDQED